MKVILNILIQNLKKKTVIKFIYRYKIVNIRKNLIKFRVISDVKNK